MFQTVCKECSSIFKSNDYNNIKDTDDKIADVKYNEKLIIINCSCGNKIVISK